MKSVLASTHQGNGCFFGNNAGYQCTAIALAALIFASFCPMNEWRSSTLDDVLFYGDSLYSTTVESIYMGQQVYLMPSDLPKHIRHLERELAISYRTDEIHGTTSAHNTLSNSSHFLAVPLEHGLVLALCGTDFSLLTVGQLTVAIIHNSIHDTYYVYDSHSRDAFGNPSSNGASVLLSFPTLEELCIYIQRTYVNQLFNLTPALITDDVQSRFNFAPSVGINECQSSNINCTLSQGNLLFCLIKV